MVKMTPCDNSDKYQQWRKLQSQLPAETGFVWKNTATQSEINTKIFQPGEEVVARPSKGKR